MDNTTTDLDWFETPDTFLLRNDHHLFTLFTYIKQLAILPQIIYQNIPPVVENIYLAPCLAQFSSWVQITPNVVADSGRQTESGSVPRGSSWT